MTMLEAFTCFSLEINQRGDTLWDIRPIRRKIKPYQHKMTAAEKSRRIAIYCEQAAKELPLTIE
jgi:hypothetical protein